MKISSLACLVLLLVLPCVAAEQDRLVLDAKINNQSVRLAFDTGSSHSVLLRKSAERLGLRIEKIDYKEPLAPGRVPMDLAEECRLDTGFGPQKFRFWVIDLFGNMPSDIDGFVCWNDVRNYVVEVNPERPGWGFMDNLPKDLRGWEKRKIVPNSEFLAFEYSNDTESVKIGIDTGSSDGVELSPARWRKWKEKRVRQPATLIAKFFPGDGMVVREMLRARKIGIGGLDLADVPVTVATPSADSLQHCDATLGLYAFRQLKLLVDARHDALYFTKMLAPTNEYPYNELGAVFVPKDQESDDLVAHVIIDGPAYRAGVRDGDVLLKMGVLNVTVWRTDPYILPLSRFWSGEPTGTKMKLTLKHGDHRYDTTITLEELSAVE